MFCLQVSRRIQQGGVVHSWHGHILSGNEALVQDSLYRPQDLRVNGLQATTASTGNDTVEEDLRNYSLDDMEAVGMEAGAQQLSMPHGSAPSIAFVAKECA
jgi:hypothetical protein